MVLTFENVTDVSTFCILLNNERLNVCFCKITSTCAVIVVHELDVELLHEMFWFVKCLDKTEETKLKF